MRLTSWLFLYGLGAVSLAAAGSPLLNRAAENWQAETGRWACTMQVREWEDDQLKEERVERFDPSRPAADRWELVQVDGRPPTEERRAAWQKAQAKKHPKAPKLVSDYLDFENAQALRATAGSVSYHVPLRSSRGWWFPVDHIALTITVNKASHAVEQVQAGMDEPFRMALGLARIVELNFDLKLNPSAEPGAVVGPATAQPRGVAHVVIAYLGKRVEYSWSEFQRVTPAEESPAGLTSRRRRSYLP